MIVVRPLMTFKFVLNIYYPCFTPDNPVTVRKYLNTVHWPWSPPLLDNNAALSV